MSEYKRDVFSIEDENDDAQLETGEPAVKIFKNNKILESNNADIEKQKKSINNIISKSDSSDTFTSRKKSVTKENLDNAIFQWFTEKTSKGEHISAPILYEKAVEINGQLGGHSNFRPGESWLRRFKSKYSLRGFKKLKPKSSNKPNNNILRIVKQGGYHLRNVYNAREFVLDWKALPRKSSASCESTEPSLPIKDRFTVLACTNGTGSHRLPLLVIGEKQKPSYLEQVNMHKMPFFYISQKNACLDITVLTEWFRGIFLSSVYEHQLDYDRKIPTILILRTISIDQSCDFLCEEDVAVCVMSYRPSFLPKAPIDIIIDTFKRFYRKELLRKLLSENQEGGEMRSHENMELKESLDMIEIAWNSVKRQRVKEAWNKILYSHGSYRSEYLNEKDVAEMVVMLKNLDCLEYDKKEILQWINKDDGDLESQVMQDSKILDPDVIGTEIPVSTSSTACSNDMEEKIISASEAFTCLDIALRWFETQTERKQDQISVLKEVRELADRKRASDEDCNF